MIQSLEPRFMLSANSAPYNTVSAIGPDIAVRLAHSTATLATAVYAPAAVAVGDKGIFAGGLTLFDNGSNTANIYDASTGQWSSTTLPIVVGEGVAAGDKALFYGGPTSPQIEIYDNLNDTWSTASLSQARGNVGIAAVDGKVFFAGGDASIGLSNVVDIYDAVTGQWSVSHLSVARKLVTAVGVGNEVIFAGGVDGSGVSNQVDIYNVSTGQWSSAHLSVARAGMNAAVIGDTVIFAGGGTGSTIAVDIYDATTGQLTSTTISGGGPILTADAVGSEAIFAGAVTSAGTAVKAEIYNAVTGLWSSEITPMSDEISAVANVGNQAIFAGYSNQAAVYDALNGTWSTSPFSLARTSIGAAAVGDEAIFAGGTTESFNGSAAVDIYTDTSPDFSLNGEIERGAHGTLSVTINNIGDASVPAGYSINVYAFTGRSFGRNAVLLGTASLSQPLAAGAAATVDVSTSLPSDLPAGQYDLLAAAAPNTRGHVTLFASILDALSIRAPRASDAASPAIAAESVNLSASPFSMTPIAAKTDSAASELASAGGDGFQ